MDRIDELVGSRLKDREFIHLLGYMNDTELKDSLAKIESIHDQCLAKVNGSVERFKQTGIPADPAWFDKTKDLVNIRKKHILMIEREIKVRHNGK